MATAPLRKTSLADQAYAAIRDLLLDGRRFRPGDKIGVEELTRELEVSRSPVWAALNRLTAEGLVEVRPRTGVFFRGFDAVRLQELYAVRCEVEAMAVRLACAAPRPDLEPLRRSLAAQDQAAKAGDIDLYSQLATDFHDALAALPGNAVLAEQVRGLNLRIRCMCLAINRAAGDPLRQAAEHAAIVAALAAGDAAAAEQAVRRHVAQFVGLAAALTCTAPKKKRPG